MIRPKTLSSTFAALLTNTVLAMAGSALAADVTPERLLNPDKEPQNWLMNHRTYDGQRFPSYPASTRPMSKDLD
jgi:alcohol dehydrogenase (cytochrome c)